MKLLPLVALLIACGETEVVEEAPPAQEVAPAPEAEAAPEDALPTPDPATERLYPRVGIRLHAAEDGSLNANTGETDLDVESKLEVRPQAGGAVRYVMLATPEATVFQIWDLAPEEAKAPRPRLDSRLSLGSVSGSKDRAVDLALSALPRETDWCVTPVGPRAFSLNNEPLPAEACTLLFVKPEAKP